MTTAAERLRELDRAATPGPWTIVPYMVGGTQDGAAVAGPEAWVTDSGREGLSPACSGSDAELIATLRNALPALADALDALEEIKSLDPLDKENTYRASAIAKVALDDVNAALEVRDA